MPLLRFIFRVWVELKNKGFVQTISPSGTLLLRAPLFRVNRGSRSRDRCSGMIRLRAPLFRATQFALSWSATLPNKQLLVDVVSWKQCVLLMPAPIPPPPLKDALLGGGTPLYLGYPGTWQSPKKNPPKKTSPPLLSLPLPFSPLPYPFPSTYRTTHASHHGPQWWMLGQAMPDS